MDRLEPAHSGHMPGVVSETCQVLLNDIEVMADIGALAKEIGVLQPLRIDVALSVIPPSSDELAQAVDYREIRRLAHELAAERTVLIETFALRLARGCLACGPVLTAEVWIGKPQAIPGCMAGTRVVLSQCVKPD